MRTSPQQLITATLFLCLVTPAARAEITFTEVQEENLTVVHMTVTPAPAPTPAFKYRLVMPELDLKPGNAASYYYRAFLELDGPLQRVRKEYGEEEFDSWFATTSNADKAPLDKLPLEKVREAESKLSWIIDQYVIPATSYRDCDWQLNIESVRGPETISYLLPEFQESRQLNRLLLLRTRLLLAERRFEDAIDTMRMNYRLAVDIARVPFYVCGLIGIAEAGTANGTMLELVAQPDSPNMYWALAELPDPLIDLRAAARFERGVGPRIFPFIHHAETTERSPEEWNRLYREAVRDFYTVANTNLGSLSSTAAGVVGTGYALVGYPHAKAWLIEHGFDRDRVERMAVGQVIAIYTERVYGRLADELEKIWYVPIWEARALEDQAEEQLDAARPFGRGTDREILPIAGQLMPAVSAARNAQVRLERDIAAMRVIEALRMYAAEHGAKLPNSLDDIQQVPVPMNPATGKPFEYRLDGDTAILELPPSDRIYGYIRRFEIKIADESDQ